MRRFFRIPFVIAMITIAFMFFAAGYFFGHYFRQDSIYVTSENDLSMDHISSYASSDEVENTAVKININNASAKELSELKGIGPVLADRIVAYRKENGAFTYTFEIMNVSGIGKAVYEDIKDDIIVN